MTSLTTWARKAKSPPLLVLLHLDLEPRCSHYAPCLSAQKPCLLSTQDLGSILICHELSWQVAHLI